MSKKSMLQPLHDREFDTQVQTYAESYDELKEKESDELAKMLAVFALLIIMFAAMKIIHIVYSPLKSEPVEPFRHQAGYWKV
jgi:hypothetical protein